MKTIAISGYFDPLHIGHLEYIELAAELGDHLTVIVNNDFQCELKKGKSFMWEQDRVRIIQALKPVDSAFLSVDKDLSVCESLSIIQPNIFANGGDRTLGEIPETKVMKEFGIKMIDGLGSKIRSSSELTGLKAK
jgi:D-beta-D-heptose 7-phosphate kinase/D-beta-D-heptose 1-phosphate adenosyltransferase|tara:strand:+ start:1626 stop:2030 length:405 start_codon:yes stop_codon:yes gene_type:complete